MSTPAAPAEAPPAPSGLPPVPDVRPPSALLRAIDQALDSLGNRSLISTDEVADILLDLRAEA